VTSVVSTSTALLVVLTWARPGANDQEGFWQFYILPEKMFENARNTD